MKKISFAFITASLLIMGWACKKSSDSPSVSFTASALDSSKIGSLDSLTIVNIIQNHTSGYFVAVQPNVPTSVYNKTLYFTYTGGSSNFRVIYTGDTTVVTSGGVTTSTAHVYLTNPLNDSTIVSLAYNFPNSVFGYQYPKSGTYTATVVATDIKNTGTDFYRTTLSQTYIIK